MFTYSTSPGQLTSCWTHRFFLNRGRPSVLLHPLLAVEAAKPGRGMRPHISDMPRCKRGCETFLPDEICQILWGP